VDIVGLMLHNLCVEWNCHYFFPFDLSYSCMFLFCLLVLPYYMVNKDEYIIQYTSSRTRKKKKKRRKRSICGRKENKEGTN